MADPLRTDLRLIFSESGADLAQGVLDYDTVDGRDNLVQALKLRLLITRGEIGALGHPRYGSQVQELIGETMDRANLELLRRYVRVALKQDPRVDEVSALVVTPRPDEPGAVDIRASVVAVTGEVVAIELGLSFE
jgi:phage baseplate assembly protein W